MTRRFFSGSTLDQAVMLAARHHGVDPDELAYRQIERRHGFLRTRKAVVISVDPDHPRREPAGAAERPAAGATAPASGGPAPAAAAAGPAPAPSEAGESRPVAPPGEPATGQPSGPNGPPPERAPRQPGDDDELLAAAERAAGVLLRFAGIEASATARPGTERIEVEIEGPDSSLLVVEGGKGLLSIQHLLPRMLRGLTGRTSFVRADSEGFHEKRKERLQALARKEAEAASREGSPRMLPPMAPDERRIVHLALKDSPSVVTESRGSGLHKRVVIQPADGRREADGGTSRPAT